MYFGAIDVKAARIPAPIAAPGEAATRKHPRVAVSASGDVLFVWTDGTAWARGGSLTWQVFDASGRPTGTKGSTTGIPAWSFAAAVAQADGGFTVLY